jgi:hypothetical protein
VLLIFQEAIGVLALAILLLEAGAAISLRMRGFERPEAMGAAMVPSLCLRTVLLLGVAACAFEVAPRPWLVLVGALVFCCVGRLRRRTRRSTQSFAHRQSAFVEDATLLAKTQDNWGVVWKLGSGERGAPDLIPYLRLSLDKRVSVPQARWLERQRGRQASPLRLSNRLVAGLTAGACAICLAVGASAYVAQRVFPQGTPPALGSGEAGTHQGTGHAAGIGRQGATPHMSSTASGAQATSHARDWSSRCLHLPGFGAPEWAQPYLNALYLGGMDLHANSPPGTAGGCTARAISPTAEGGSFVYTVGRGAEDEVLSLATVSRRFGPAIFLAPAAKYALALIEHGRGPVGGLPTITAANGDVSAIMTELGTFALVRPEEHIPGEPNLAAQYVELPPAVSTAWMSAQREVGHWLWPRLTKRTGAGETFLLATQPAGERGLSVDYEPATGDARRAAVSVPYEEPSPELNEAELSRFARTAGP